MSVVEEAVKDGIGNGGLTKRLMPKGDWWRWWSGVGPDPR
jgi:hypothetical protein